MTTFIHSRNLTVAWNRSSVDANAERTAARQKKPRRVRLGHGLAGALLVVAGAFVAWYFVAGGKPSVREPKAKVRAQKAEKRMPAKSVVKVAEEKGEEPVFEMENFQVSTNSPVRHVPLIRQNSPTSHYFKAEFKGKLIHHNAVEQAMVNLFTCPLGATPKPIGHISEEDCARIREILADTNQFVEDDTEADKACRQVIADAKAELAAYLDKGGTVNGFFSFYRKELINAHFLRSDAEEEVQRILDEENDPGLARAFQDEVNKKLSDKGILKINVSIDDGGENREDRK